MRSILAGAASVLPAGASLLLAFGSAVWVKDAAGLNDSVVVSTVILTVTLARTQQGAALPRQLLGLAVLPLVAVAACEVGDLLDDHFVTGGALFVLGIGGTIWLRRFGPLATTIGSLATPPFVVALVDPVPSGPGAGRFLWAALAALIAAASTAVFQLAAVRAGVNKPRPATPPVARGTGSRLAISDRMAGQMVLGLAAAFLIGRLAYPSHWPWTVLTTFIVCSGNRGRADVLHKGVLRISGAAVGTVAATLLAGVFPPRDPTTIAVILVVLVVATWLRGYSYAYWAGCVTGLLALLYGYYGQTGTGLLFTRVGAIVVGAAVGIAATWFVLPVRSTDVLRRRTASALAALNDVLDAVLRPEPARFPSVRARFLDSLARLDEIKAPFEAQRRLRGRLRRPAPHPADAVDALHTCAGLIEELEELEELGEPGRLGGLGEPGEPEEAGEPGVPAVSGAPGGSAAPAALGRPAALGASGARASRASAAPGESSPVTAGGGGRAEHVEAIVADLDAVRRAVGQCVSTAPTPRRGRFTVRGSGRRRRVRA
ncbi:FUSC family protein [Streptomyces sp. MMS24-I2-30]|uniref:FUSC family protein n=1 Tax=Streptomyces sp. MMS24-I2-30 TaxID=3351564 RepID=UPI003896BC34